MYAIGVAAMLLGVCPKTLRRWDRAKKIRCVRTIGGHRRFPREEIERVLEQKQGKRPQQTRMGKKRVAIYARVSSYKQQKRGDLARQINALQHRAEKNASKVIKVYKDVGSGLNTKRKGLWRLLRDAK
ncbi:MAG: helix-turn-helix domain-containing protein, partial [Promethearchaeota archaeon]